MKLTCFIAPCRERRSNSITLPARIPSPLKRLYDTLKTPKQPKDSKTNCDAVSLVFSSPLYVYDQPNMHYVTYIYVSICPVPAACLRWRPKTSRRFLQLMPSITSGGDCKMHEDFLQLGLTRNSISKCPRPCNFLVAFDGYDFHQNLQTGSPVWDEDKCFSSHRFQQEVVTRVEICVGINSLPNLSINKDSIMILEIASRYSSSRYDTEKMLISSNVFLILH